MKINKQTLISIDGLEYRFGCHNLLFALICGEWVKSANDIELIKDHWIRGYMRRVKLPPQPHQDKPKHIIKVWNMMVKDVKKQHLAKVEYILKSNDWMQIRPHEVMV